MLGRKGVGVFGAYLLRSPVCVCGFCLGVCAQRYRGACACVKCTVALYELSSGRSKCSNEVAQAQAQQQEVGVQPEQGVVIQAAVLIGQCSQKHVAQPEQFQMQGAVVSLGTYPSYGLEVCAS